MCQPCRANFAQSVHRTTCPDPPSAADVCQPDKHCVRDRLGTAPNWQTRTGQQPTCSSITKSINYFTILDAYAWVFLKNRIVKENNGISAYPDNLQTDIWRNKYLMPRELHIQQAC
jgi:hypothetical protein